MMPYYAHQVWTPNVISIVYYIMFRLVSSVCIVADYGLEDPGSNPGGDEIFRNCSDRHWVPKHPPVQWVTGLSQE